MSGILPISRPMRRNKIAQDAPGTSFSRGWLLWYPLFFDHAYAHRRSSLCNVIGKFRTEEDGVDAAVPVDAKNAPTSDLQNRKERGFAQRPHRSFFSWKKKPEERTTKQLQVCQFRLSQQRGSPHGLVLSSC